MLGPNWNTSDQNSHTNISTGWGPYKDRQRNKRKALRLYSVWCGIFSKWRLRRQTLFLWGHTEAWWVDKGVCPDGKKLEVEGSTVSSLRIFIFQCPHLCPFFQACWTRKSSLEWEPYDLPQGTLIWILWFALGEVSKGRSERFLASVAFSSATAAHAEHCPSLFPIASD